MASIARFAPRTQGSDQVLITAYLASGRKPKVCAPRKTSKYSKKYFYMAARTPKSELISLEDFKKQERKGKQV